MNAFSAWQSFYEVVGASAGTLIGLQFVALSLIAARKERVDARAAGPFSTPTVVHFGAALALSALMCAPWETSQLPLILIGTLGGCGVVYSVLNIRRILKQPVYRPEAEDWIFHVVLPSIAYLTLVASAYSATFWLRPMLFAFGAAALVLLFAAIHNAWDAVTYHVFSNA